jgi:hypothetical protein
MRRQQNPISEREGPINIPEIYDYLVRARRDLWTTLEGVPDEVLSRPLLDCERFRCIKDLVMQPLDVEDGWIHGDILRDKTLQHIRGGPPGSLTVAVDRSGEDRKTSR